MIAVVVRTQRRRQMRPVSCSDRVGVPSHACLCMGNLISLIFQLYAVPNCVSPPQGHARGTKPLSLCHVTHTVTTKL